MVTDPADGRSPQTLTNCERTFTRPCPECHETCEWCSAYRWRVRELGCMALFQRRWSWCHMPKAESADVCGTCHGARTITVTETIK
jgi:hypothetical protein